MWNGHISNMMQCPQTTNTPPRNADERRQINIVDSFDADIVLRKVIEDRASILALKKRAAANEAELMKAR